MSQYLVAGEVRISVESSPIHSFSAVVWDSLINLEVCIYKDLFFIKARFIPALSLTWPRATNSLAGSSKKRAVASGAQATGPFAFC